MKKVSVQYNIEVVDDKLTHKEIATAVKEGLSHFGFGKITSVQINNIKK